LLPHKEDKLKMLKASVTKPAMGRSLFSLKMSSVDELFPGFASGDFTLLYRSSSVISLTSLLCVGAQAKTQITSRQLFLEILP
jgi:hypothetical protein